jgi:NAD(P)-dependent dehydrogenase (short-subunit alcohol dehydrogenase family)
MNISGNAFLVTGGSSGLGAGCVRRLAADGGRVVIADMNVEAGEALAEELGGDALFVRADVTDEASVETAVSTAVDAFGPLRGAISCAGIVLGERLVGRSGPHDLARFRKVLEVNAIGTFNVLRIAAAAMMGNEPVDDERGVLINTASVAAFDGQIGQAAYSASKGAVVGILRHADDGRPAGGGARLVGPAGPFSLAPGPAGGIRGAGGAYSRKPDAKRRGDPPGRGHPHGAKVTN